VYLAKAEESLVGAASELAHGRYNNSVNRAYYACFQAAIAALPESYHNAYSDSGNASSGAKRSSHVCANDCGS